MSNLIIFKVRHFNTQLNGTSYKQVLFVWQAMVGILMLSLDFRKRIELIYILTSSQITKATPPCRSKIPPTHVYIQNYNQS